MHWIIQKSIFKPINYQLLINSLNHYNLPYIVVTIPTGTFNLIPDVTDLKNVYVCGAIKMAKIAQEKNWYPGSFLNSNYDFSIWLRELPDELLNTDCVTDSLIDIDVSHLKQFFIRPTEDNKAFDGMIMDFDMLLSWRKSDSKKYLHSLPVIVSSIKQIEKEYRFFIVNRQIITGSLYKLKGKSSLSTNIPEDVTKYVESIINRWLPSSSVVIDVAVTNRGFKIIEFNNINSSGFYAIDIDRYVLAIEKAYNQA